MRIKKNCLTAVLFLWKFAEKGNKIPVPGMKTDIINKIGKRKEKKWLPRSY